MRACVRVYVFISAGGFALIIAVFKSRGVGAEASRARVLRFYLLFLDFINYLSD